MHIKHLLPLAAASLLLSSAAAFAGDWSGFYVGAEGGAQFNHSHFALPGDTNDVLQKTSNDKTSFIGGGLVGYNFQADNIVYGVEGDIASGGGKNSVTACNAVDGCFVTTHDSFTTINNVKTSWTGRLRARLGFAADDMLFYAAAGYSYGDDSKLSLVGLCYTFATPTIPTIYTFNRSKNLSGFNVGAGIERPISDHFVVRAEYVYDDFGSTTYPGGAEWNDRRISENNGSVRVAVAYHF